MDLVCSICAAAFRVDDALITASGGEVPCPTCKKPVRAHWPDLELDLNGDVPAGAPVARRDEAAPPPQAKLDLALDDGATPGGGAQSAAEEIVELEPLPEGVPVDVVPTLSPMPEAASARAAAQPASPSPQSPATTSPTAPAPKLEKETAPMPARSETSGRPSSVGHAIGVSVEPSSPWRVYAAVGGTAFLAIATVVVISVVRSRPPPPPDVPNPLKERVVDWKAHGLKPTVASVDGGVQAARTGLASGSDRGLRQALEASRSTLLLDPESAAAIAVYAAVLGQWPDRVEPEVMDDALGAITSAIHEDPKSIYLADLEESRAWLLLRGGRLEAARQAAGRAASGRPDSPGIRMLQAVTRIPTRAAEAVSELEALTRVQSSPRRVPLWLGEAQLTAGEVNRALGTWSSSLRGGDEDVAVLRRLARLSADVGDYADAELRLRKIADAGWAGVEDRLLFARLLSRVRRDPDTALTVLDDGLKDSGLSPMNRARMLTEKAAVAVTARSEIASAAEVSSWLDTALDLAPDLAELLYVAGLADEKAGAVDNAINSLEAAVELAPDRPEVAARLALLLRTDTKAAAQVLDAAIHEAAQYVPLHLVKAALELNSGNGSAASGSIRRARDYDPERYGRDHFLDAFVDAPAMHVAVAKLLTQGSRHSDNAMITTAAGMAYFFADDMKHAELTLAKALKSDPGDVGARLYRAVIALKHKRVAVAKKDLQAALKVDSMHLVVRYYQARVLEETKKPAEAEKIYRDLIDKNPLDTGARIGLAQALWSRGSVDLAREEAVKVLTMRPGDREALRFLVMAERRVTARKRP